MVNTSCALTDNCMEAILAQRRGYPVGKADVLQLDERSILEEIVRVGVVLVVRVRQAWIEGVCLVCHIVPPLEVSVAQSYEAGLSRHGRGHESADVQSVKPRSSGEEDIERPVAPRHVVIPSEGPFRAGLSLDDEVGRGGRRGERTVGSFIEVCAVVVESFPLIDVERAEGIAGLHDLHGTAQVAVVGRQDKVVACQVDHLVLHVGSIEISLPHDTCLHGEGMQGEFDTSVFQLTLVDPIGASAVVAGDLFLEEQVSGALLEPVKRKVDAPKAEVETHVKLRGLLPRQVGRCHLVVPIARVACRRTPAIGGAGEHA